METSDLFKPITEHLIKCRELDCPTCRKVLGDEKPIALVLARIYEFRDDSTPREVE